MTRLSPALFLLLGFLVPAGGVQSTRSPAGVWSGNIELPNVNLPITVTLNSAADGSWTGSIDIPAQNLRGAPLSTISVEGQSVTFHIANLPGDPVFKGTLANDSNSLSGNMTQGTGSFAFQLAKGTNAVKAAGQGRTQEPKPPFPYKSEDVTFRNEGAGIRLAGTVTVPSSGGPFPSVVLISGSGPQDRDETLVGHKPFLVLADHLTRARIAVLRVDDRGVGGSDRGSREPTSEDLAGDVRAAVDYLKSRSDVAKTKIGLIGHSEGGIIAPMLASTSNDIAFIVLMAGSGVKGEDLLYLQGTAVMKAQGATEDMIRWNRTVQQRIFGLIEAEPSGVENTAARRKLTEEILPEYMSRLGIRDETTARNAIATQIGVISSVWFRFFLKYDPAPALTAVRCPVLALIGENDAQVPYKENLPALKAALERGGNRDATVMSLPKLNHLFQTSVTGAVTEYESIDETVAPSALELISTWIVKRFR